MESWLNVERQIAHGTSPLYTEVQVSMLFTQLRAEYITYTYLGTNVTHVQGMCSIDETKKWGTDGPIE